MSLRFSPFWGDVMVKTDMQSAVMDAVNLVNRHSGQTAVRLQFSSDDVEIDFIANSATCKGGAFEFTAGFETYGGRVDELTDIQVRLIEH